MKNVMLCLILFGMFTLSVFGELTQANLNKISLIVNESEERVKKDIIAEIDSTKKDIKEYIDIKIDSVEKRLSTYNWVIYVLMPLIVAAIGIPTAIIAWSSGKDRSLEKHIETLKQEIETLKQQRIVTP
jgi:anaerobic ribonucleoside-triphosphate reductase